MRIVVFGDSIAQGYLDDERGGWVDRLKQFFMSQRVATEEVVDVYNCAVSGSTIPQVIEYIKASLNVLQETDKPICIVLACGVNEARMVDGVAIFTPQQQRQNIEKLITAAKQYAAQILVIGCTPAIDALTTPSQWNARHSYPNATIGEVNQLLANIAQEQDVEFVSVWDEFNSAGPENLLADGLHPNVAGHTLIAELVKPKLEELVRRMQVSFKQWKSDITFGSGNRFGEHA